MVEPEDVPPLMRSHSLDVVLVATTWARVRRPMSTVGGGIKNDVGRQRPTYARSVTHACCRNGRTGDIMIPLEHIYSVTSRAGPYRIDVRAGGRVALVGLALGMHAVWKSAIVVVLN